MGRKLLVGKGKFKRVYEKSKSAPEIAKKLKISVATVYKYIERYNLASKNRVAYRVADKDIILTMQKAKNLNHGAKVLGMSVAALTQRCYRLGISMRKKNAKDNKESAYKMIDDLYVDQISAVAESHDMEVRKCRYLIDKYMYGFCVDHNLPIAGNFTELRIALCIKNDRRIRKNVRALENMTGIDAYKIKEFLELG